jgi:hypothetical protein
MRKVAEHEIPCQQMLRRSHTQIVPSFATQPNDTQSSGIQAAIIKVIRYGHTLPHATAVVTRYRGGAHAYLSLFLNISQHLPAPLCRQKDHQPPHSFLESLQEIGFKRTSPDNAQPQAWKSDHQTVICHHDQIIALLQPPILQISGDRFGTAFVPSALKLPSNRIKIPKTHTIHDSANSATRHQNPPKTGPQVAAPQILTESTKDSQALLPASGLP